ncbi:MAG: hypothetical protein QOK37_296 [Thermoanaerobaculia bacterium]|nr:hypothetical protein [Thermoanaerobaculia bacterium]
MPLPTHARVTITGEDISYSFELPFVDAIDALLLCVAVPSPPAPLAADSSLLDRLREHNAETDREHALVTLQWLHDQGCAYGTALTVNDALRSVGQPEIRYVSQALKRCTAAGECVKVNLGQYALTEHGSMQLAAMRDRSQSLPSRAAAAEPRTEVPQDNAHVTVGSDDSPPPPSHS